MGSLRSIAVHLLVGVVFCCVCRCSEAGPTALWEDALGDAVTDLHGEDDHAVEVAVSFPFPYGGNSYTSLWIGTNGALALGGIGEADTYPSGSEFIATADPMVAPTIPASADQDV